MRILIVSYFAESHLANSSAQNTRLLASGLMEKGYEVRVVCAGAKAETILQDGYSLTKLSLSGAHQNKQWLGAWRPDVAMKKIAQDYLRSWKPDVVYMGAWQFLAEFAYAAKEQGISVVQMVHDYSILCLLQWMVDSWGNVCAGPELKKCTRCVRNSLGWKDKIKDAVLSLPLIGDMAWGRVKMNSRWGIHAGHVVNEAYSYLARYRDQVDIFLAQSPMVIEMLRTGGVDSSQCRLVPQFIGEEKLQKFPRAEGTPAVDRPFRFVYVGRWSYEKGAPLLLDAFVSAKVTAKTSLWIISKDASAESILASAGDRLSPNKTIEVFNGLQGAAVSEKLAQGDVCLVPSVNPETGSRVVIEAQSQGVPLIVTNVVGNRYLVQDHVNGRIIASGDVAELSRAMESAANDPSVIQTWAKNKVEPVDRHAWLNHFVNVFDQASIIAENVVKTK